jgi:hypothetical protein
MISLTIISLTCLFNVLVQERLVEKITVFTDYEYLPWCFLETHLDFRILNDSILLNNRCISIFFTIILLFSFRCLLHCRPHLLLTSQRLGEVAAPTNVYAGYKISITHFLFRGVTAAIAPNRKLCAGIFGFILF